MLKLTQESLTKEETVIALLWLLIFFDCFISALTASGPLPDSKNISVNFYLSNTHNAPSENKVSVTAQQTETQKQKEKEEVKPQEENRLKKITECVIIPALVIINILQRRNLLKDLQQLRR